MREFSHKLITFFLDMVEGGEPVVSQAQLKKELVSLVHDIYNIDLSDTRPEKRPGKPRENTWNC